MGAIAGVLTLLASATGVGSGPADGPVSDATRETVPVIDAQRYSEEPFVLDSGIRGRIVPFKSRNPAHFREWFGGDHGSAATLTGQLFIPSAGQSRPLIIMIPGSGNIGPHHLHQAGLLVTEGFSVFLIDPFYGRGFHSTASDQGRLSWAGSVHDIFAAIDAVADEPAIDVERIGLLGSSRGGFAVIMAMMEQVAKRGSKNEHRIKAGFAGYPWCGLQFWRPQLAHGASLEIFSGNRDNWVSVQQCQDLVHALAQSDDTARIKLLGGAGHAFDRSGVPPTRLADVPRTTRYPTVYMDDDGHFMHPRTGDFDPSLNDDFFLRQVIDGGFIEHGVTIGAKGDEAAIYAAEMVTFFRHELGIEPHAGGGL